MRNLGGEPAEQNTRRELPLKPAPIGSEIELAEPTREKKSKGTCKRLRTTPPEPIGSHRWLDDIPVGTSVLPTVLEACLNIAPSFEWRENAGQVLGAFVRNGDLRPYGDAFRL